MVVTNEILERHGYLDRTVEALRTNPKLRIETYVLPDNDALPSEATKTLENLGKITDYAIEKALDRKRASAWNFFDAASSARVERQPPVPF